MPKQSKTQQTNGSTPQPAVLPPENSATAEPKKRVRAVKQTAPKKTAAKKAAVKSEKKSPAPRAAKKSKGHEPSDEEIRIRAYFLAERRAQSSSGGNPAQDWLDARQQLIEEAAQAQP